MQTFNKTVIDLGTGDGRFVFKNALKDPKTLFIGIDPSEKQMAKYSKKAARKRLDNALFVVGSIEHFPKEITPADEINIILPWGTLLEGIVKVTKGAVEILVKALKPNGRLNIIFGYHQDFEPSEAQRLKLPILDDNYIKNVIVTGFENYGLKCDNYTALVKEDLKNLESSWGKKLSFGKERKIFQLQFKKL